MLPGDAATAREISADVVVDPEEMHRFGLQIGVLGLPEPLGFVRQRIEALCRASARTGCRPCSR